MRQTDIKTIYLTAVEVKQALANYIQTLDANLAVLVDAHDLQLILEEQGMIVRIDKEIEISNTNQAEYIIND